MKPHSDLNNDTPIPCFRTCPGCKESHTYSAFNNTNSLFQDSLRQSVKEHADTYNTDSQQLRELRLGEDKDILVEGTVIGMTTTGAARYRRVLAAVACPIVILEEAAEVSSSCCTLSVSLSSVSVSVC